MTRRFDMGTGKRFSPVRGGAWVGLIVGVFVGFLLAAGLLAAFLWFLNGTVSAGVEGYLKKYVFDGTRSTFGTFQADLWKGRFVMTDLRLQGERSSVTVPQLTVDVPVRELISGNGTIRTLQLDNPLLEGTVSFRGRGGAGGVLPGRVPGWVRRLPIAEVVVADGQAVITNRDSNEKLGVRNVRGHLRRGSQGPSEERWDFQADGKFDEQEPATFSIDMTVDRLSFPLRFNGEWNLTDWPLEPLARFVSGNGDVRVQSGRLNLKTQALCKDDWLTASHLVDITDFKVEVDPRRKELLGVPVKRFKDLMDIPSLSFVVPMNGSIRDPQVGFSSSVQQILYKIFEGKIQDKKDLDKWVRRGGDYLGGKIDAALRSFFKNK
ncbi:MAG: DUF748 domain-containing protein [Elusimicrobia bacterium]|nr:DUF748 domain-containing protein [Elusimicrobiota bacterium]